MAQNENALVTAGGISLAAPLMFVAGPLTAGASSLLISPNSLIANNVSTATLTTTAPDAQGNPGGGRSVSLTASGAANNFGAVSGTTDATGQFITSLAASQAQNETITATLNGNVTTTATVAFVAVTASPNQSSLGGVLISNRLLLAE